MSATMPTNSGTDFGAVFDRLRAILEPYGSLMHVTGDSAEGFGIDMAPEGERDPTSWFAGVRMGKAYVSYYLMPVYVEPSLIDDISPELRRRMQGKSCFNFRSVDDRLFAELADLTRRGYERSAGDPGWGVRRREVHDLSHRRATSKGKS